MPSRTRLTRSACALRLTAELMFGAIAGDVIGSVYEGANVKSPDFEPLIHPDAQPTDDTILTCVLPSGCFVGPAMTSWIGSTPGSPRSRLLATE